MARLGPFRSDTGRPAPPPVPSVAPHLSEPELAERFGEVSLQRLIAPLDTCKDSGHIITRTNVIGCRFGTEYEIARHDLLVRTVTFIPTIYKIFCGLLPEDIGNGARQIAKVVAPPVVWKDC